MERDNWEELYTLMNNLNKNQKNNEISLLKLNAWFYIDGNKEAYLVRTVLDHKKNVEIIPSTEIV